MNWTSQCEGVGGSLRFTFFCGDRPVSFGDAVAALRNEPAFRTWFNALLAGAPFPAFRWETPGVTAATARQPFECVVRDAPELLRELDAGAFAEHFRSTPGAAALEFPNLSGDATLVVPGPVAAPATYGHLAPFVRGAPEPQRDALWRLVGEAVARRLGARPMWLSTG